MNPDLWLALMSIALVAPAMLVLLYVTFTGRLGSTEDARFLPLLDPDHDFWDPEDDPETTEEGGE